MSSAQLGHAVAGPASVGEPSHATHATHVTVVAPVHPLTVGAAPFNAAMTAALARLGPVDLLGWSRPYPPLLYRGPVADGSSRPAVAVRPSMLLAWDNPLTWRRAVRRMREQGADALVLPWLHPVTAPPYRWLLRHAPAGATRVVICHNVVPHERLRGGAWLTSATLRHADVVVTHAPHQRAELAELGLGHVPVVEAFHPRFVAADLAPLPSADAVAAERARQGGELRLLCFGAVRPYKGVDLAREALARLARQVDARLVVAGRFWNGTETYQQTARRLGVAGRVELRDAYVPNDEAGLLFAACDLVVLPYRAASQSGVAQLAYAYGKPVVATRVGGLPAAVTNGVDGLLCAPHDPEALAGAIRRAADGRERLAQGVAARTEETSFDRYAGLLRAAAEERRS
jgi:glycosyltransferase involved in cell wall biosynthesis